MATLFSSRASEAMRKLKGRTYGSSQERDALVSVILRAEGIKRRELIWMLFVPDRTIRQTGIRLLWPYRDIETVDLFLAGCKDKPAAALRGAAGALFELKIAGTDRRLAQLSHSPDPVTAAVARKLILEAPPSPALTPVLWELAGEGGISSRALVLDRLAEHQMEGQDIAKWVRIARDEDQVLQEKALTVLALKAPNAAVELFVERLPRVGYTTQQRVISALAGIASKRGPEFCDRILPLMASADAGTRSAVIKILLGMRDRREVVKRYLIFSKTLAGWARDRTLDSMRAFGEGLLEPVLELLNDPDEDVRSLAIVAASTFDDPRIGPAAISLLKDKDWWIRITAADTLGRLQDRRAVPALIEALADPEVRWAAVEALGRIGDPAALQALERQLEDPAPEIRVEVLLTLQRFEGPEVLQLLQRVATQDPSRALRMRALEVTAELARRGKVVEEPSEELRSEVLEIRLGGGAPRLHELLVATRNRGASDLHIAVSEPPMMRIAAELVRTQDERLTASDTATMLRAILTEEQWERLKESQYLDFCYYIPDAGRYRGNIFLDHQGYQGVFRVIPEEPPTIADIGLPPHLATLADYHQGLVLVCGPGGSGKSTTVAALVNLFNETRSGHILSLEDPVEIVHPFKNCLINQREVGKDTQSYARALRGALREDPDVIVIGELRDSETIAQSLVAAETGHVVLATLNSTSTPKAVDRIIASFPLDEQAQIRTSLSESLAFVIAQRLLPSRQAGRQVACFEILKGTLSVSNLIREDKTYQLPSTLQIGREHGMQSFDDALRDLVRLNRIEPETAYMAAQKREDFESLVSREFLEKSTFF